MEQITAVEQLALEDPRMLNGIYKEVSDSLGAQAAIAVYRMFRGQQITFPMRLLCPQALHRCLLEEYDGGNMKQLAQKYDCSEKTIRRVIQRYEKPER